MWNLKTKTKNKTKTHKLIDNREQIGEIGEGYNTSKGTNFQL